MVCRTYSGKCPKIAIQYRLSAYKYEVGTLAVDGCTFSTARMGLGGAAARPDPTSCTKSDSPPINGQCSNQRIAVSQVAR